ncbi:MAG TPA: hypothetical protein VF902_06585 [Coriobacteriia bacterium]
MKGSKWAWGLSAVLLVAAVALVARGMVARYGSGTPPGGASAGSTQTVDAEEPGVWLAGDMHTHTLITDGSVTQSEVARQAFETYALDWFANSEHGGQASHDASGQPVKGMWRWRSLIDASWPAVLIARSRYPMRLVVQGLEWGMPGLGEASVGLVSGEPTSIASFEFAFDSADAATSGPSGAPAKDRRDAASAVRAVAWLQANHQRTSYVQINHPSRKRPFSAADLRRLLDAGPDVVIGFEGFPGHQKAAVRGDYARPAVHSPKRAVVATTGLTQGGADPMVAEVGGLWDSLLSEGRRFCVFANSDFHSEGSDFWPGEYAKSWTKAARGGDYDALVAGLQSGRSFAVTGGLIDRLRFEASSGGRRVAMGDEPLVVEPGADVTITVRFRSPRRNAEGDEPAVDHVDLISNDVTAPAAAGTPGYSKATSAAQVARTFGGSGANGTIRDSADRWREFTWVARGITSDHYFRLRGTNLAPSTAGQTEPDGDPLPDAVPNSAVEAWKDLWFYSNPVWIDVRE